MLPDPWRLARFLTLLYINLSDFQYITPDPYLPPDNSPEQCFSRLLTFIEHLQWQGTLRDYTENEVSFYTYIAVSLIHSDLC